jgi:hypothetical protein
MAERNPVPPATKDDAEDVSWALSTAEAMWTRGDKDDAVKWIRRAVESASEAGADDRALQLAKAAADLASYVGPVPTPPAAPVVAAGAAAKPVASPSPAVAAPRPAVAVATTPRAPAAVRSPAPPIRPAAGSPPAKPAAARPATPANEPKPAAKPRPALPLMVMDNEVTQEVRVPPAWEATRRAPAAVTTTPVTPPVTVATEEIDAWPTQSLGHGDLEQDELTRIGEPAYASGPAIFAAATAAKAESNDLHPSQAVRVIVWRSADGVHVAPHGTKVSAIGVEAMLVALDPAADLAAWLAKR